MNYHPPSFPDPGPVPPDIDGDRASELIGKTEVFLFSLPDGSKLYLHHDEDTLHIVFHGLIEAGLNGEQAQEAIMCMMNQGIVFREVRYVQDTV